MKNKRSVLTTVLCIVIALVVIGVLLSRGVNSDAPQTDEKTESLQVLSPSPEASGTPDDPLAADPTPEPSPEPDEEQPALDEEAAYNTKDEVALYIRNYGHLPPNYVTKTKAREAGWYGGSLESYFPGCSIGGDVFGNREGLLPDKEGRTYYECDIETAGKGARGAKRIVYSNDGLIYYTEDHYESFTLLYGEENA